MSQHTSAYRVLTLWFTDNYNSDTARDVITSLQRNGQTKRN